MLCYTLVDTKGCETSTKFQCSGSIRGDAGLRWPSQHDLLFVPVEVFTAVRQYKVDSRQAGTARGRFTDRIAHKRQFKEQVDASKMVHSLLKIEV